jgi:hypothetical protein
VRFHHPLEVLFSEPADSLQLKVSTIREATLSNSLSPYATLREFLAGRTLVIVRCIWEVHALKTHIEVCSLHPFYDSQF